MMTQGLRYDTESSFNHKSVIFRDFIRVENKLSVVAFSVLNGCAGFEIVRVHNFIVLIRIVYISKPSDFSLCE